MQLTRKVIKKIYIAATLLLAFTLLIALDASAAPKKKFVVVIDAGHGGNDHGAIENGLNEKDVNLAVALKLGEMIKKKLKDTEVVYTRNTDQFITLQKRADIANEAKADLFISIHCNSVDRSNKNRANVVGATTYVLGHHKDNDNLAVAQRENAVAELDANDATHFSEFDPDSDESNIIFQMTQKKNFQNSIRFATDVQREMTGIGRVSRGVQQAGFWVLWSTAAPAALIELDFICNPEQAKFLGSSEGQEKLAGAIFNAVKKYETYFKISLGQARESEKETKPEAPKGKDDKNAGKGKDRKPVKKGKKGNEETAQESEPVETPEETVIVSEEFSPAGGQAELPSADTEPAKRRHRSETAASTTKKSDSGTHRRRSSSSRAKGASQVEETMIAMNIEQNTGLIDIDDSTTVVTEDEAATSKKKEKKAKDKKDKKEKVNTKPARRDKDKKSGKVKKGVNVGYRVLLFISDDELKANDEAFHGLSPVASYKENNKYKYTYGESDDRKEMEALMLQISGDFPDARVIKCYY